MADEGATLVIDDRPTPLRPWFREVWCHREVLGMLARKDFHVRYKRATFGVLWAVGVPVLQGVVMAAVFSKVVKISGGSGYASYVLSGVLVFAFFSGTVTSATTAIVDGASLTDKVWFPRVLLVLVPGLANLVSFGISLIVLGGTAQVIGKPLDEQVLWFVPGLLTLFGFTLGLSLVLSALHVYFRDAKFFVQAAMLVWLYATPVLYPKGLLGSWAGWTDLNPMTGVVSLFHRGIVDSSEPLVRPVLITVVYTVVLLVAGIEAQRRHDRLFVDLL